jgi:hypothetical protein
MDWFNRYVVAWKLAISLERAFCLDSLHTSWVWPFTPMKPLGSTSDPLNDLVTVDRPQ